MISSVVLIISIVIILAGKLAWSFKLVSPASCLSSPLSISSLRNFPVGYFCGRPRTTTTVTRNSQRKEKRMRNSSDNNKFELGRLQTRLFMTMKDLPGDAINYSTVPKIGKFTANTIPAGLLKDHSTKVGTWGLIRIFMGSLEYSIAGTDGIETSYVLTTDTPGIIEPTVVHSVKPLTDDVEFQVEFYRQENTGPVEEPREGLDE